MKKEEPGGYEINIPTETIVRVILVIGLFAVLWFLRDIILVVITAVVFASAVEPAVRFFVRKNVPRLLGLVVIYGFGIAFLAGLFYFFVPAILDDLTRIARTLPAHFDLASLWNPLQERSGPASSAIEEGLLNGANLLDFFKSGIEEGGALRALAVFFGGFFSLVFIVVLSFYLAAQEKGIENFLRLISPIKSRSYVVDLWKRSQIKIGLWFQGQLLLGLLVGVLTFLGLSILGVPSALLLSVLIAFFELIPVFGPVLAAVPALAIAYTEGMRYVDPGLTAALFVALFYFIIQQFESHLIYPLVVRKVVGIPPVLVILALIIGAKLAGFLGILLSVPLAAVLMEFLNDVARERKIYED